MIFLTGQQDTNNGPILGVI